MTYSATLCDAPQAQETFPMVEKGEQDMNSADNMVINSKTKEVILKESKGNPKEQSKMMPKAWVTWANGAITKGQKICTELNHCNKHTNTHT